MQSLVAIDAHVSMAIASAVLYNVSNAMSCWSQQGLLLSWAADAYIPGILHAVRNSQRASYR